MGDSLTYQFTIATVAMKAASLVRKFTPVVFMVFRGLLTLL